MINFFFFFLRFLQNSREELENIGQIFKVGIAGAQTRRPVIEFINLGHACE